MVMKRLSMLKLDKIYSTLHMTMILNWKVRWIFVFRKIKLFPLSKVFTLLLFDISTITEFFFYNNNKKGACGAELACSTCHLIFDQEIYTKLPEMEEEEEDMLDLAFEVTDT